MLVIGNGESRKGINISKISDIKVGCNAIHRDYDVQHLVCVDKRMVNEALSNSANNYSLVYTRKDTFKYLNEKRIRRVPNLPYVGMDRPDDPQHWGSGPYAVLIAAQKTKSRQVHMLGFDLYSKDKRVNNIYKDTPNYNASEKSAVDPRYWIYQIGKVIENYPLINFTVYQEDGWQLPKAWKYPQVTVDNISNIYYNT